VSGHERTGWRDPLLSLVHKRWGFDSPATDVDLFIEYDHKKARGLVEYKHEAAQLQRSSDANNAALINLCNRASVSALATRYRDDYTVWTVTPLNQRATDYQAKRIELNRAEYVTLLYRIRGREPPRYLIQQIRDDEDLNTARAEMHRLGLLAVPS
jgi:hypothetical protein